MVNPVRVLVIDDSAFMRIVLTRMIASNPSFIVIDTASDGREGFEKALQLQPDVITLDVEMPAMNGLETLRMIVAETTIPVVMVSAITRNSAEITVEALASGAFDFISKGNSPAHLHDKLLAAVHARSVQQQVPRMPVEAFGQPHAPPALQPHIPPDGPITARVVVIGSSTGGPQALHHILPLIPSCFPVPIIVAQHMPPHFTHALARRLDAACMVRIVEASDREPLQGGTVYIAPGGSQTRVTRSHLLVREDEGESLYKPSVAVLAESARRTFGAEVLAVMLTGMGNDGMRAFCDIRASGGHVIAQDAGSCVVYGMPRAVIEAGGAHEILPVDMIGVRLRRAFPLVIGAN